MKMDELPGSVWVRKGLEDLAAGAMTEAALLVLIGAPRLRRIGIAVPNIKIERVELRLYELLERNNPDGAHSRYNALIRSLVSFERAAECVG